MLGTWSQQLLLLLLGGTRMVITMYVEPKIVILPLSMWVCVVNKFFFNRRKVLKKSCMTPTEEIGRLIVMESLCSHFEPNRSMNHNQISQISILVSLTWDELTHR